MTTATTADELSDVDREALTRARAIYCKRSSGRQQIENRPWLAGALLAAYACQCDALRLPPWQPPPCDVEIDANDDGLPILGRKAAAELLRRLLANNLSRYEPNPVAALAQGAA
jgi:hypothetical protein